MKLIEEKNIITVFSIHYSIHNYCSYCIINIYYLPFTTVFAAVPSHLTAIKLFRSSPLFLKKLINPVEIFFALPVSGVKCPAYCEPGSITIDICSSFT